MENSKRETHFDVLNIPLSAQEPEIEEAYLREKEIYKADPQRLGQLQEAYNVLINPLKRERYKNRINQPVVHSDPAPDVKRNAGVSAPIHQEKKPNNRRHTEIFTGTEKISGPEVYITPAPSSKPSRARTEVGFENPGSGERQEAAKSPAPSGKGKVEDSPSKPIRKRTDPGFEQIVPSPTPSSSPSDRNPHGGKAQFQDFYNTLINVPSNEEVNTRHADSIIVYQILISYKNENSIVQLHEGENIIGRPTPNGSQPAIPLPDDKRFISRRHAIILLEGNSCVLKDEGSDNGTLLNGTRLQRYSSVPLKTGDEIKIEGRVLKLTKS